MAKKNIKWVLMELVQEHGSEGILVDLRILIVGFFKNRMIKRHWDLWVDQL
jgi:hypothetical protein